MPVSSPPFPARLREMLKDYPDHIADLQRLIASFAEKPTPWSRYEELIWAFEDSASSFFQDAGAELKVAKESGDVELILKADAKEKQMGRIVLQKPWLGDAEFRDYFRCKALLE